MTKSLLESLIATLVDEALTGPNVEDLGVQVRQVHQMLQTETDPAKRQKLEQQKKFILQQIAGARPVN